MKIRQLIAGGAVITSILLGSIPVHADPNVYTVAYIYPKELIVRAKPNTEAREIDRVYRGQEVEVVEKCGDWAKVCIALDSYGYINAYHFAYRTYYADGTVSSTEIVTDDDNQENYNYYEDSYDNYNYSYEDNYDSYDYSYEEDSYDNYDYNYDYSYEENSYDYDYDYSYEENNYDYSYDYSYEEDSYDYSQEYSENNYYEEDSSQYYPEDSYDYDYEENYNDYEEVYYEEPQDEYIPEEDYDVDNYYEEEDYNTAEDTNDYQSSGGGQSISDSAKQYIGNPYVWGGESLSTGADCSGFTKAVLESNGYSVNGRTAADQAAGGTQISLDEAEAGDLIYYNNGSGVYHIAIYNGDGTVTHSSNSTTGVTISDMNYSGNATGAVRYW